LEQLLVVVGGGDVALQEQVRVRVDEPGQHGGAAQVDPPRVGGGAAREGGPGPHRLDAVAAYQNALVGASGAGLDVDQAPRMQEMNRGRGRSRCQRERDQRPEHASTASLPSANWARKSFLSNLPTLVRGTASMKAKRSGNQKQATRSPR